MAVKFDNIHYSFRAIDGYNKPFNFVLSPRELGKTTTMWYEKIYLGWKKDKRPWIYLVRQLIHKLSDKRRHTCSYQRIANTNVCYQRALTTP